MHLIHIPKTAGTSIRSVVEAPQDRRWQGHYPAWTVDLPKEEMWTVVRDPYDRAISMFCNFCEDTPTTDKLKKWYTSGDNRLLIRNPDMYMQDSMSRYVHPEDELLIGTYIKFENLEYEIGKLFNTVVPHKNVSKRRKSTDSYYDSELEDIIYQKYKDDFINFNYKRKMDALK